MAHHPGHAEPAAGSAEGDPAERPIVRTATEARQGEVILGRRGRWVWIATFALMLVILIALLLAY